MTFIEKFLKHNEIYESPKSFWLWSAYATIAAVLTDNCAIRAGDSAIYPNIFILLLAESSGHRKGRPIQFSQKLVSKIDNTKVISGRSSVQAIMDDLSNAETDRITGKIKKAGSAIFYAEEFSAGMVADPAGIQILTDIYDYKPNPYKNRLRTGPNFTIDRIVLNLFAGSNEKMLKGFFEDTAIQGGMLARTFLVVPNEFRPSNSLLDLDEQAIDLSRRHLVKQLEEIALLNGDFTFTKEAKREYNEWYNPFRQKYKEQKEASGIVGRIHTGVLKVAMILAANEVSLVIGKEHVEEAITVCLALLPNYGMLTMSAGKSTISVAGGIVLPELLAAKDHMLSKKMLLRNHWQDFDDEMLTTLMNNLEAANIVKQVIANRNEFYYQLTQEGIDMLEGKY